jgi:outer membrane protein TolC
MRAFLTFVLVLAVASVTAQTTYLTFYDALSLGLGRNPAVTASEYAVRAAHRERQATIGLFMPRVSVRGAYAHLNKDVDIDVNHLKGNLSALLTPLLPPIESALSPILAMDLSYTLQSKNTAFLGGDVVLPLFTGGKILAANRAAKVEEARAHDQGRAVRGALVVEVVERYFGVELARRGVAIRSEAIAVVEQHLRDVSLLEREGMAVESERLYAEYRLAEAQGELRKAELQLATAQRALQTSLSSEGDVLPSTPLFLLFSIEPLDYFQSMASLHNPQLAEVGHLHQLSHQNMRAERAELMPEVVAMAGGIFCDLHLSPLAPRMAVGVGLNFRIFDGLRSEYRYSAARLQERRVEHLEAKAQSDVALLVESLYRTLQETISALPAVRRSERFAEEYLRAKRRAFGEGVATSTDVVDAALNLSQARLERIRTAYEMDVALARLLEASGMAERYLQYLRSSTSESVF